MPQVSHLTATRRNKVPKNGERRYLHRRGSESLPDLSETSVLYLRCGFQSAPLVDLPGRQWNLSIYFLQDVAQFGFTPSNTDQLIRGWKEIASLATRVSGACLSGEKRKELRSHES